MEKEIQDLLYFYRKTMETSNISNIMNTITSAQICRYMSEFLLKINNEEQYDFGEKHRVEDKFGSSNFEALNLLRLDNEFSLKLRELMLKIDEDEEENVDIENKDKTKKELEMEIKTFIELLIKKVIEMVFSLQLCTSLLDSNVHYLIKFMQQEKMEGWENLLFYLLKGEETVINFHGLFRSLISNINNNGKVMGYEEFPLHEQVAGETNFVRYVEMNGKLNSEEWIKSSRKKIQVDYVRFRHVTPKDPDFETFQWFSTTQGNCTEVISDLIFDPKSHSLTKKARTALNQIFHSLFYKKPMTEKLMIGFLYKGHELIWTVTAFDSFGDYKRNTIENLIYTNKVDKVEQIPMLISYIELLKQEKMELQAKFM